MPASKVSVVRIVGAVALLVFLGACARNGTQPPHARLGSTHRDGAGHRYGGVDRSALGDAGRTGMNEVGKAGDDVVYFASDSSSLTAEAKRSLAGQVAWLRRHGNRSVMIEGHADERGTREYNIALGARRAAAVKQYLVAAGISAGRLRTTSYGKERPIAACDDISCWSQNRRAQTVPSGLSISRR
ncbi:MAG: peptidoglycan-associated lipoprotein Pal [Hyphomicrobiaceae bacterium]